MESTLNTELLATMLKDKRGNKGLRAIAQEIGGVSFATLSRIEQGKIPDVDTFVKICKWLGVSTDTFIIGGEELGEVSTKDMVDVQGFSIFYSRTFSLCFKTSFKNTICCQNKLL